MKNARHAKILEIIEEFEIGTQEGLIDKLAEYGIKTTQTTISRDIRQLKLIKGPTGMGTYKYVAPKREHATVAPIHNSVLTDSILSIDNAQNIIVSESSDVKSFFINNGDCRVSVITHLFNRLPESLVRINKLDKTLRYNEAHYIHRSTSDNPRRAVPITVAYLECSGIWNFTP